MSSNDDSTLPTDFSGQVRLFPLPNLVMFPHGLQALHVFEPRYCRLLEDSLANDHLIAMALLQPGWEPGYEGRPPVFPVACIGRIMSHSELENGRHNILLRGLKRASIVREIESDQPYRTAEVALLDDCYSASASAERSDVQTQLHSLFCELLPPSAVDQQLLRDLQERDLPLGVLADIVAFTFQFDVEFKLKLLQEWNVDLRAQMLVERMACMVDGDRSMRDSFPPKFSDN